MAESYILARVLHVLAVVIWIGGVVMVSWVIIPAIKRMESEEDKLQTFETIEGRFSSIAKITTLLTGISGFYMLYLIDGWDRYLQLQFWWIHAMTLVWLIFTLILFVFEPFVLPKVFHRYLKKNPDKAFAVMHRAHLFLLALSLITVAGAVAGSHGWLFA